MKSVLIPLLAVVAFFLVSLFLDKIVIPWQTKRRVAKTLQQIQEGKIKRRRFDVTIVWDAIGFSIWQEKASASVIPQILWSEVIKVSAYKRDLWSTDLICIFLFQSEKTGLEIHEEMNGWSEFIEALPIYLHDCKSSSWVLDVAFPAFATNITELYSRTVGSNLKEGKE